MTSVQRSFALPVNGATVLTATNMNGTSGSGPWAAFIDMRYSNVFTFDVSALPHCTSTFPLVNFDTRANAPVQNTGKLITIIITGITSPVTGVATHYSANFTGSGPIINQINANATNASVISLMSNGTTFANMITSYLD